MEIGVAVTHLFIHSTKNAFKVWVTQVWSRKTIFKVGLEHFCKSKKIFFSKGWSAQIREKMECSVMDSPSVNSFNNSSEILDTTCLP